MQNSTVVFQLNISNNTSFCASISRPNAKPQNVSGNELKCKDFCFFQAFPYLSSMKSEHLKLELIQWLTSIEDKQILQSLFRFKNMQENTDWWDTLSDDQLKEIEKGIDDVKKGKTISNKSVWQKYGRTIKH